MHAVTTPIWVEFRFVANQPLQYDMYLPQEAGLYVIYSNHAPNGQQYYIGPTDNLYMRFQPRFAVCHDLGLAPGDLTHIRVYTIEVWICFQGQAQERPNIGPSNEGRVLWRSGMIDVEHLLIRTFMQGFGCQLRNAQKTDPFQHVLPTNAPLLWTLDDRAGIGVIHGHSLDNQGFGLMVHQTY
jgi:hypothetical protein